MICRCDYVDTMELTMMCWENDTCNECPHYNDCFMDMNLREYDTMLYSEGE